MTVVRARHDGRVALPRPEGGSAVALADEPGHLVANVLRETVAAICSPVRAR